MKNIISDMKLKNITVGILRSCLFKIFIMAVILSVLITGVLFYKGDLRYKLFRLTGEVPATVYFYLFRGYVYHRDFSGAVNVLNSQLNLVQNISSGNNYLFLDH